MTIDVWRKTPHEKVRSRVGLEQVFGKVKRLAFGFFKMVT
jgi:hypothetical protein